MNAPHLNNEQFAAHLLDPAEEQAAAAHLRDCAMCREELERFKQSVDSFNHVSLAWSEARPVLQSRKVAPSSRRWFLGAAWAFAACLLLLIGFSATLHHRDRNSISSHSTDNITHEEDSETEIARDNQLMIEVTGEINRREQSPALEYGLPERTSATATTRAESRVE